MACKYSYAIPSFAIFLYGLFLSYKRQRIFTYLLLNCCTLLVINGPLLLVKYELYKDPFSPLLEGLKEQPQAYLVEFVKGVKAHSESPLTFPLGLIFPASPGQISTIFGLGFFVFLLLPTLYLEKKDLFFFNLGQLCLTLLFAKHDSRFFFESYLLISYGIIQLKPSKLSQLLTKGLALQVLGLLPLYLFACVTLFPGAITENLRNKVLRKQAYLFNIGEQVQKIKPEGKTLMLAGVSYFSPANFIHGDISHAIAHTENWANFLKKENITLVVSGNAKLLIPSCSIKAAKPFKKKFQQETRNPFNRTHYEVYYHQVACP